MWDFLLYSITTNNEEIWNVFMQIISTTVQNTVEAVHIRMLNFLTKLPEERKLFIATLLDNFRIPFITHYKIHGIKYKRGLNFECESGIDMNSKWDSFISCGRCTDFISYFIYTVHSFEHAVLDARKVVEEEWLIFKWRIDSSKWLQGS